MAGNAVIGALRVTLGADTAALEKGLKGAQVDLQRFATQVKNIGLLAAGAFAGIAGGLSGAIKGSIDEADKLGKLAQSVGVPVEELSRLKHAADLSGVGIDALGKSMGKLSRTMGEAAKDVNGEAAHAFRQLGINVRNSDGTLKSSSDVIQLVAGRFENMKDGAAKTALAIQLFGRAGADMIPMLNAGASGIKAMMLEADQLGIVITDKTAKAAESFNDNLTRLGRVKDGIIIKLTAELLPALERFSQFMIDGAKNSELIKNVASGLTRVMDGLMRAVVLVYDNFVLLAKVAGVFVAANIGASVITAAAAFVKFAAAIRAGAIALALFTAIKNISIRGLLLITGLVALGAGAFDNFTQKLEGLGERIKGWLPEGISKAITDGLEKMGLNLRALEMDLKNWDSDAATKPSKSLNDIALSAANATKAIDGYLAGVEKRKAGLTAELQTIGLSTAAQEKLRIQLEAEALAKEKNIPLTDALRAKIDAAATSYGTMAQAVEDARTRWQFVEGSINTVASGLTDIVMRTKPAAEAFKEMALSIIRDFTNMIIKAQLFKAATAFMSGLGGGGGVSPVGGYSMGGTAVPVAGFNFAQGGSFVVPGAGGIDSKVATMRLTPGERVSVTKDGGYPGGAGGFTYAPQIDARGADVAAVARLEQVIARDRIEFEARVKSIVRDRGPKRW